MVEEPVFTVSLRTFLIAGFGAALVGPGCTTSAEESSRIAWDERIEVATGEAHRGPWRMNDSDFRYVDDPAVTINDSGYVAVVWGDQSEQDIFLQIYDPEERPHFEEPVNISATPDVFSWLPRVKIEPSEGPPETIHVLWQEIIFSGGSHGGEILFARSGNGGESFDEPLNLSNTTAGAGKGRLSQHNWHNGSLGLALGPADEVFAVWTEYEGELRFTRSKDGGQSFSKPVTIAGDGEENPARGPSLAVATGGRVALAWTVGEDAGADIRFAISEDGGRSFEEARQVGAGEGRADAPKLAIDRAGTVHLVYGEEEPGIDQARDSRVLYARLAEGAEGFETPRVISGKGRAAGAGFPSVGLDEDENVYVTWELFPRRDHRSQGLGFALSIDGGDRFTEATEVPGARNPEDGYNGSQQGLLMNKLAVNAGGDVAVVNSTFHPNRESAIWLVRGRETSRQ